MDNTIQRGMLLKMCAEKKISLNALSKIGLAMKDKPDEEKEKIAKEAIERIERELKEQK